MTSSKRSEPMSSKILPLLAIPAIALGMLTVSTEESEAGRGFRMGFGFHKPFAAHRSVFHRPLVRHRRVFIAPRRHFRHRPVIVHRAPVIVHRAPVVVRRAPVIVEKPVYVAPRRVYTKPVYSAPSRVVETARVQRVAAPAGKSTDGEGRIYDRASKTWFDGANRCYKGTLAWAFKGGEWLYGSALWEETEEGWVARDARQPRAVDCAEVAAFADKVVAPTSVAATDPAPSGSVAALPPPVERSVPRSSGRQVPTSAEIDAPKPAAKVTAEVPARAERAAPAPAAPAGNGKMCERYLPGIGAMITVPCAN
jgi:hypothetical protein